MVKCVSAFGLINAMVDGAAYTGGPTAQVWRLGPKVGGRLALFCIHRVNRVNSRNNSWPLSHCLTDVQCVGVWTWTWHSTDQRSWAVSTLILHTGVLFLHRGLMTATRTQCHLKWTTVVFIHLRKSIRGGRSILVHCLQLSEYYSLTGLTT